MRRRLTVRGAHRSWSGVNRAHVWTDDMTEASTAQVFARFGLALAIGLADLADWHSGPAAVNGRLCGQYSASTRRPISRACTTAGDSP